MKINHNISALKANVQLNKNDGAMSKSLEKLTSGFKINHASDDPAGMAISRKMKAQIRGLKKVPLCRDGISLRDIFSHKGAFFICLCTLFID